MFETSTELKEYLDSTESDRKDKVWMDMRQWQFDNYQNSAMLSKYKGKPLYVAYFNEVLAKAEGRV